MTDAAATPAPAAATAPAAPAAAPKGPKAPRQPVVRDTPPADIATVQGQRFPPKPSPKQQEARDLRKQLGHVVAALMADQEAPMRNMGASLMCAHMAWELGDTVLAKYTAAQVQAYGHSFRAQWPAAWGAAAQCNIQGFVRFLKIAGLRSKPGDSPLEQQIVEYQKGMSQLSAQD